MRLHRYQTLGEMLLTAADEAREDAGYRFLDGADETFVSFHVLAAETRCAAGDLQRAGLGKGERVMIIVPTSHSFAVAFYSVVLCGAVPCVLPAPSLAAAGDGVERLQRIADQIGARRLIAREENLALWLGPESTIEGHAVVALMAACSESWSPVDGNSTELAYIQATSGSTGSPKCVALTHGNLLSNLEQIGRALHFTEQDVLVGWLPLFHDMGLIGCFLMAAYWRFTSVLMSPYRFLRAPISLLKAISKYRGTVSGNPTFAYALAASKVRDEELAGLDLSSWTKALCGSEPVNVETLERFQQRFHSCGLPQHCLVPCYGLAEASLAVTMHPLGTPLGSERIQRTALADGIAVLSPAITDSIRICDCGSTVEQTRVEIRTDTGEPLPDGRVGHVWIAGPSVMYGYYNAGDTTQQVTQEEWLDSGDFGYLRAGRLFITGRHKDLVIIRGQKWLPMDFEAAASEVAPGRVVAFGIPEVETGTEGLCLLCEESRSREEIHDDICGLIYRHVAARTGVIPTRVVLVSRNSIPHTTSGKLQRSKARNMFLAGSFVRDQPPLSPLKKRLQGG